MASGASVRTLHAGRTEARGDLGMSVVSHIYAQRMADSIILSCR